MSSRYVNPENSYSETTRLSLPSTTGRSIILQTCLPPASVPAVSFTGSIGDYDGRNNCIVAEVRHPCAGSC